MPSASKWLTALSAHERVSTIPKLHRANTVAWGLLRGDRWCMIVVRHWSKPAWQNMAFLLMVVGLWTPYNMPEGGKADHPIFKKPPLVRGGGRGGRRQHYRVLRVLSAAHGAHARYARGSHAGARLG